ncbi:SDR family oxidoreductase [Kineococcus rhizosphaerae]|uniref:NADP-dependent 3-hydroxy acid dehydrogenase YdfG n=1 Tax=Kineococcus rhizosphaerae TaxID=559628 RepID=A0A2T0R238_9ACTN|nr:SDR family NAD(P)-dependent oxidoreductase [Kineococcus rhizosphaerae]PRY13573.1 NADP-dependent 3-hydroxy acid dehydrogenase YdfG [Kineococcus rhizosphaerae]
MQRVLWITGAGSGMGRAVARSAAAAGWTVVLSGRRAEALRDSASGVEGPILQIPLDVRDGDAVRAARARIVDEFGRLDALVLAAGRNTPRRQWDDQDVETFHDVVAVNLNAVVTVIDAALPDLRASSGVAVVVSSYAGWAFHPGAGVAYSASKSALSSVVRTLNSGEAAHGVRATHLCPGDVATDFLDQRPNVPDAAARARMLTPEDIARTVQFVLDSPAHVRIDELVVSPVSQR